MPSLTYAELAEALKVTPASANKLARRRRWPRVPGNDGKARVSVPEEALVRQDSPPDSPVDSPQDKLIKALEAHVETMKVQLEARSAELVAERATTARAIAAFSTLVERLDALAAERARPWWRRLISA